MLAEFFAALGTNLAKSLATDLVKGLGVRLVKRFRDSETIRALEAAIGDALTEALPHAFGCDLTDPQREAFEELLTQFFKDEDVVAELTLLLDPRPGVLIDTKALAESFPYHFTGFEPKRFLDRFVEEFYPATVRQPALKGLVDTRLLAELVTSAKEGVRVQRQVVDELAGLRRTFADGLQTMIESGDDRIVVENVNVLVGGGWLDAYSGYEALLAVVRGQGYEVDVTGGDRLELEAPLYSEQPRLPAGGEATVRRLAAELRRAVLAHDPGKDDLDALERRYRQRLDAWLGHLEFRGMMRAPRPIRLPLADVYVDLRAVAEVPEAADAFSVDERRLLLELEERGEEGGERHDEKRRDLTDQLDALRRERWSRTLPERKPIADALHRGDQRAFVVLGDPGSGKTTLLHFLTLIYARSQAAERLGVPETEAGRLPIFVPLAAFDDMRKKQGDLTLKDFLALYYDTRRGLPGLAPLFDRALESGRALVLFDGLDEVLDVNTRRFVADQVAALMNEGSPRGVRFVLSSRVVGYREAPVSGRISTLTVLDFGLREIEVFVRQWARAFEVWLAEGESAEALEKAAALERDLMVDVSSNASVQRLTANPLMLTMLALLRRQVGRLPHRRIELYEKYVETLLENWIEARSFGARTERIERLDRHQAENVLIPLALWLQQTRPSGTARRQEMHARLTEIYLEEEGLSSPSRRDAAGSAGVSPALSSRRDVREATPKELHEAEAQAERFLREMRSMAGLIIERGHDAYGFLHLTFQEHFAGRALAQLGDEERWEVVRRHLHDPRWREPILLCAGRLGIIEGRRVQVTSFVRRIFENEDPTEPDLRRNLLLALAVVCDDVNPDTALIDSIVEKASGLIPAGTYVLNRKILESLGKLVGYGTAKFEKCLARHLNYDDMRYQKIIATTLEHCLGEREVRAVVLKRLNHPDEYIRMVTLRAVARRIHEDDIRALILKALSDKSPYVRGEALRRLAPLRPDIEIRSAVLQAFNDESKDVRAEALRTVAGWLDDQETRSAVLQAFNDESEIVRKEALQTTVTRLDEAEIRAAFFRTLHYGSESLRGSAFRDVLIPLDDAKIRATVLRGLDESEWVREGALLAVATRLDKAEIRAAVVRAFQDKAESVRAAALRIVKGHLNDKELRNAARDRLADPSPEVRVAALDLFPNSLLNENRSLRTQFLEVDWPLRKALVPLVIKHNTYVRHLHPLRQIQAESESASADPVAGRILVAWAAVNGASSIPSKYTNDHRWQVRTEALRLATSHAITKENRDAVLQNFINASEEAWSAAFLAAAPLLTESEVRDLILQLLDDSAYGSRRQALHIAARFLAVADIRAVVLQILNDQNQYHRLRKTALQMLSLSLDEADARTAFLQAFNDDSDFLRGEAVRIAATHLDDTEIREAVLRSLNDDSEFVRSEALLTAVPLMEVSEARKAVLQYLDRNHPYDHSIALRMASHLDEETINTAILQGLRDCYYQVRQEAIQIAAPFLDNEDIQSGVLSAFQYDIFPVRLACIESLVATAFYSRLPQVVRTQVVDWISVDTRPGLPLFLDSDFAPRVQEQLAGRLAQQLPDDANLYERLLTLLGDARASSRLGAALTLLAWPSGPPEDVRARVLAAVDDRRDLDSYPARLEAASYLINRNETSAEAVELCLEALDYGTRPWEYLPNSVEVRKQAALVLSKLEPLEHNQRAYDKLLGALRGDEDADVRDAANEALVRLARVREMGEDGGS